MALKDRGEPVFEPRHIPAHVSVEHGDLRVPVKGMQLKMARPGPVVIDGGRVDCWADDTGAGMTEGEGPGHPCTGRGQVEPRKGPPVGPVLECRFHEALLQVLTVVSHGPRCLDVREEIVLAGE